MRGHFQQSGSELVVSWVLVGMATVVYLLTLDRSASWWDCGEFITTSDTLQVGHPPGAPFYQLLAHLFTFFSFGNRLLIAPLSNALSAIAGGLTVGILFRTIARLFPYRRFPYGAVIGALCYLFCDTVWFSAVESEVYSLAMFFCAATVWEMLQWERRHDHRRLLLVGLMLGLGIGVHLMTLLTTPALLLIALRNRPWRDKHFGHALALAVGFFLIGITPYAIIPIRAAAHPPINEGNPSNITRFQTYITREQYEKAPLYPRMWRQHPSDQRNYSTWNAGHDDLWGNIVYYTTYQLGYMYCRYLMYNFIGRQNEYTTAEQHPDGTFTLYDRSHIVLFILPFLLGLIGLVAQRRRQRAGYYPTLVLFLFGGIILNLYLNHPCYEPRERDYAYVLSFYAFAIWIGAGAQQAVEWKSLRPAIAISLIALAPLSMAIGNWADHDRHHTHATHDLAMAHLQSCDDNALLITLGDNDTFPLWYLLHVEHQRPDIDLYNINLTGVRHTLDIINDHLGQRPIYFSQYAYHRYADLFGQRFRCEGLCYRLLLPDDDPQDLAPLRRHVQHDIQWHLSPIEHLPYVAQSMLLTWNHNIAPLNNTKKNLD